MKYEKNLASVVSLIKNGEKNIKDFKIGVEIEHIVVNKDNMESVGYYGAEGIESILRELLSKGYKGNYEGGAFISIAI
jgi:glutamate--cysteine ligase